MKTPLIIIENNPFMFETTNQTCSAYAIELPEASHKEMEDFVGLKHWHVWCSMYALFASHIWNQGAFKISNLWLRIRPMSTWVFLQTRDARKYGVSLAEFQTHFFTSHWLNPIFLTVPPCSTMLYVIHPQYPHYFYKWGPPVLSWFISPSKYCYKYNKP